MDTKEHSKKIRKLKHLSNIINNRKIEKKKRNLPIKKKKKYFKFITFSHNPSKDLYTQDY